MTPILSPQRCLELKNGAIFVPGREFNLEGFSPADKCFKRKYWEHLSTPDMIIVTEPGKGLGVQTVKPFARGEALVYILERQFSSEILMMFLLTGSL